MFSNDNKQINYLMFKTLNKSTSVSKNNTVNSTLNNEKINLAIFTQFGSNGTFYYLNPHYEETIMILSDIYFKFLSLTK